MCVSTRTFYTCDSEFWHHSKHTVFGPDFVASGTGRWATGETSRLSPGAVRRHEEVLGRQPWGQAQLCRAHKNACRGLKLPLVSVIKSLLLTHFLRFPSQDFKMQHYLQLDITPYIFFFIYRQSQHRSKRQENFQSPENFLLHQTTVWLS